MSSPRIVVDALSANVGGGLTYITQQLSALERVRPDLNFMILASPSNEPAISDAVGSEVRVIQTRNLLVRLLYEQTVMPLLVTRADLLYCPANFCPLLHSAAPVILTLRNAHHFGHGKRARHGKPARKKAEIQLAHASARRADLIIVVSEFLRTQLLADSFSPEKIRVVPSGLPKLPVESTMPARMQGISQFFVSIANDHVVKRLNDLVRAWATAFQASPKPPALVLAGKVSNERIREQMQIVPSALKPLLIHLGSVSDRSMIKWLLSNARAMVSTSELESFGFTVIEAGSVGCPAIVTDIPAHLETARGNVRFFPVGDLRALSQALIETITEIQPRSSWNWEQTWNSNAEALGECFDELLLSRRRV